MATGVVRCDLRAPLVDDLTFVSPDPVDATVTDGDFTIPLAAPGNYDFTVLSDTGKTLWSFHAPLLDDVDTDISLSELYFASLTEESADIVPNITQFVGLFDTPSSYSGLMGYYTVVNTAEDGLEFAAPGTLLPYNLRLDSILDGSNLKTVGDVEGASTPLQLAEDAVKVDNATLTVDRLAFDTTLGPQTMVEGEMSWNAVDHCIDVELSNPTLQVGQELMIRIYNGTGFNIYDGDVVSIESDATGDRIHGVKADSTIRANARATVGLATEDILAGEEGFVTTEGLVRGLNTLACPVCTPLFVHESRPGGLEGPPGPLPPLSAVFVGVCVKQDADEGIIWVSVSAPPTLTELVDVFVSAPDTNHLLVYNAGTSVFENKLPSITTKETLSSYVDQPVRGKEMAQFGGMEVVLAGGNVSTGTPETATNGCGKLLLSINAGADVVGDITITGNTVDRNTGAITVADTEVVTLDGLTTDNSDTDAAGNVRHALIHAYITTKWFQGDLTITTTEVDVSDFDIYNVAFHQFGDTPTSVELDTLDITALPTNTAAWFYAYMYSLEVTNGTCNVTREASIELPSAVIDAANLHYRRKIGNIGTVLDPSDDGVWVDIYAGPFNQTYWEDITTILIYAATSPVTLS
jgi:hypothetical protein